MKEREGLDLSSLWRSSHSLEDDQDLRDVDLTLII